MIIKKLSQYKVEVLSREAEKRDRRYSRAVT